jgi:hypothetical protein
LKAFSRAIASPPEPPSLGHLGGRKNPAGFVWVDTFELVVTSSILSTLEPYSGWSSYPVHLNGLKDQNYSGLAIWGRSDRAEMDRSQIVDDAPDRRYRGMRIDPHSWDGSDIFFPSRAWGPIVTQEVYELLCEHEVDNLTFSRMDEFCYSALRYEQFIQRRLDYPLQAFPDDPLRPHMLRLRAEGVSVELAVLSARNGIGRALDDAHLVQPGIRIIFSDDFHEVDAIVQARLSSGLFEVKPIAYGHGSIRRKNRCDRQ